MTVFPSSAVIASMVFRIVLNSWTMIAHGTSGAAKVVPGDFDQCMKIPSLVPAGFDTRYCTASFTVSKALLALNVRGTDLLKYLGVKKENTSLDNESLGPNTT